MRSLNEHNITQAVLESFAGTPYARLKEILGSLVRHLHAFAREVKMTEAEWMKGIQFMTATGQKCNDIRQEFILLSDTLGLSQLVVAQNHNRPQGVTEQTVFGPFHRRGRHSAGAWSRYLEGSPGLALLCLGARDEQGSATCRCDRRCVAVRWGRLL